jgi:methionyl-tRNA formyltransferase
LSIESAVPVASQTLHGPGTIIAVGDEGFDVQCGIGSLRILEVKPEGKKNMNVRSFLAGRKISIGARFERQ